MSHQMVGTAIQPHGDVFAMAISLDHSIYFHRQLDPTQVATMGWIQGAEGTRRGEARRGEAREGGRKREEADSCSSAGQ
jgi:acyl-CoA thioesterase